jgi:hypothetical protein
LIRQLQTSTSENLLVYNSWQQLGREEPNNLSPSLCDVLNNGEAMSQGF